jgi:2-haloacid dehalogenase
MKYPEVHALTFDIFGTVVDWRGSVVEEAERLGQSHGIDANWESFADAWRAGYGPAMDRVRRGEVPWTSLDGLHRLILSGLREDYHLTDVSEREIGNLNRVWHRLKPWPDVPNALPRLRERYLVATLSNGNMALLVNLSKNAGLSWDCILSAELARHYKPDPEVYQTAADMLDLAPEEIMMVASHQFDLQAAQAAGFKTAFVPRPELIDSVGAEHEEAGAVYNIVVDDFVELAERLGT